MGGGKDYEQEKSTRKEQISGAMEKMYSRRRYSRKQGNLKNAMELVEEFEREYCKEEEKKVRQ